MNENTFDELRNMVVYPHAGALKEAIAVFQLFEAKLAEAVGAFDQAGLWDVEGARSMADWLSVACGFSRHHGIGHRKGWRVHLQPDNTLVVTHPHGHTYNSPSPHSLRAQTIAA